MRYRNGSASDAGFVNLSDNWICGSCGCANQGNGCCSRCGWAWPNGGVVNCARDEKKGCGSGWSNRDCGDNRSNRANRDCCDKRSGCDGDDNRSGRDGCQYQRERSCQRDEGHQRCNADCGGQHRGKDCADTYAACPKNDGECGRARQTDGKECKNRCHDGDNGSRRGKSVGIVHGKWQELGEMYECPCALKAGTLFPELHKPLNGYCPDNGCCALKGQAEAFALWELRLYLNTHPDDQEALCRFRRLCAEAEEPNYAASFLCDDDSDGQWGWVCDPWPWEKCFNRCD